MQDEVEVKARELLANAPVTRFIGHDFVPKEAAVRAIAAAIRQQPVVDDARMARALEWVRVMAMQDANGSHLPAIEEAIAAYDPNCGGRTVRVVDDAMVERALDAHIPGGGQVRDFGLPRWAMLAALLAAYQQDNGGK